MALTTPETIRTLQRKLYAKAKQDPAYRLYALYDKLSRADILTHAWRLVRANRGSPGREGLSFEAIESGMGVDTFLRELARDLQAKTYRAQPVRRVMIPKADGRLRPLGIPTVRDRVVQMAVTLIIEPIFEADFCAHSYGFRPKRSAQDAVDDIANTLWAGYPHVIDADLSNYFESIPHAKLLAVVAERLVDGGILRLIKQWLNAPVIGNDADGTRKSVSGGKANRTGTPQGGVISPLLANGYVHLLGMLKKAASGVLALLPCSRTKRTLRASKRLRPCWTDPSERFRACFFEHSLAFWCQCLMKLLLAMRSELFNRPLLDRTWQRRHLKDKLQAHLVRDADDFVVRCRNDVAEPLKVVRHVLDQLGLSLNEAKTHIGEATEASFTFLGFTLQMSRGAKTGKPYPNVRPADTSLHKSR